MIILKLVFFYFAGRRKRNYWVTMRAVCMGDLSWMKRTGCSPYCSWTQGRKSFSKISIYFSFTNQPFIFINGPALRNGKWETCSIIQNVQSNVSASIKNLGRTDVKNAMKTNITLIIKITHFEYYSLLWHCTLLVYLHSFSVASSPPASNSSSLHH
jgi:hypothetical protein